MTHYNYQVTGRLFSWSNTIFAVALNSSLIGKGVIIKIVVHQDGVPWSSIVSGKLLGLTIDPQTNRSHFVKVFAAYTNSSFRLLPQPYKTHCRDYRLQQLSGRHECDARCLERLSIESFNKSHHSNIIYAPSKYKHLSSRDFMNGTVTERLADMETICGQQCAQPTCESLHDNIDICYSRYGSAAAAAHFAIAAIYECSPSTIDAACRVLGLCSKLPRCLVWRFGAQFQSASNH